ncbi:hypothetical protein BB559_003341 [Furculomyces boomerangus]|uniref:Uncharacterized protein n=1 Tax=Furculomyces boomerangus TaxID=61424 RepID=A0A2T9YLT4_9FUNG|nr:hypothetical protein BB559_003341 [Furculomyces boomerangus]
MSIIAVVLACVLAVLSVRALGKTDLNPVSGIGKISQIIFAYLMPKNIIGNLVAGAIAEAGAMQSGDLMQDLKTGQLIEASPRAQFYAQFIGSIFSVFISAYAYKIYTKLYEISGPLFRVPASHIWLDMARLVNGQSFPDYVLPFGYTFGVIFGTVVVLQGFTNFGSNVSWFSSFSGMAFAIGIYNTPDFTLARFFGALSVEIFIYFYTKEIGPAIPSYIFAERQNLMTYIIVVASGFVLGEGATAFRILLIKFVI